MNCNVDYYLGEKFTSELVNAGGLQHFRHQANCRWL